MSYAKRLPIAMSAGKAENTAQRPKHAFRVGGHLYSAQFGVLCLQSLPKGAR